MDVNCYFYADDKTKSGFLFDPGAQGKKLAYYFKESGFTVDKIILTHGHFDHIGGVEEFKKYYNVPVYIHKNGALLLSDPVANLSGMWADRDMIIKDYHTFDDGDIIENTEKTLSLKVIYTPGHTADSCIFYNAEQSILFTGDTIFKGTYGRYDFPTGDYNTLIDSIKNKVLTLPPQTSIYSGHGDKTTVAAERGYYLM